MKTLGSFACVVTALVCAALAAGCTTTVTTEPVDPGPDATLSVQNSSSFAIVEIHVTPVGNASWGPNLIAGDVLLPGESLTLGVNCGRYDALLVDDDDVDCELRNLDLCLNDADWIIRNNTCTVFGAVKAAREAAAKAAAAAPDAATN